MIEAIFGNVNKKLVSVIAMAIATLLAVMILFNQMFYYNEGGYITYVQTKFPTQSEKVVDKIGYSWIGFGSATPFPRQMTVQSVNDLKALPRGDFEGSTVIPSFPVTFLGGTTATVDSNVRVSLPTGEPFLKLAQTYRNPDNFVLQAIMPVMKSTLQSTAQLMSADDYFGGGASEFRQAFTDQMSDGVYVVKRIERQVKNLRAASGQAVAQDGSEQGTFGQSGTSTVITTEKVLDKAGLPIRLERQFSKLGVGVVDANIMNVDPSKQFKDRMIGVQESQAKLMIARQDRQTADEQKKLVTARGEMQVEEKRQMVLKDQIEKTTNAETAKRLVLIEAEREQERASIEKETAQIRLDKAKIDAQSTKTLADAEAYQKRVVLEADGALAQKLDAIVQINQVWADAASKAPVPGVMMGGADGGASRQTEIGQLMSVMAVKAAKDLQVDLKVK